MIRRVLEAINERRLSTEEVESFLRKRGWEPASDYYPDSSIEDLGVSDRARDWTGPIPGMTLVVVEYSTTTHGDGEQWTDWDFNVLRAKIDKDLTKSHLYMPLSSPLSSIPSIVKTIDTRSLGNIMPRIRAFADAHGLKYRGRQS